MERAAIPADLQPLVTAGTYTEIVPGQDGWWYGLKDGEGPVQLRRLTDEEWAELPESVMEVLGED